MTRSALIIAHGQPSDPAPAEADMARLAREVAALMPGWQVGAATLAQPGAVEAAAVRLPGACVLPFFMSDGWFTRTELPRRLAGAGVAGARILPAFGLMPGTAALAVAAVRAALAGRGWSPAEACLLLAAHGSGRSPAPAADARRLADAIAAALPLREVRLGFLEQAPRLAEAAGGAGLPSLCLPLFVARWGHVAEDVPRELASAGFRGPCLAPLGARHEVPAILAEALRRAD